ncbi:hypothetical protein [Streptomyces sp. NBC_01013]|uniref:hypothetical protein n=1 Tax=Streptomyces sp. NBC_01013 TaxID=2903718 RepID=UPI00386B4CDF|nr:hypothetical protein OG538_00135 [Streptomyces sp. NBC_01013]
MPDQSIQFGAVGSHGPEMELFGLGEGLWATEDPPGERGEGGRAITGRGEMRF